MAKIKEEFVLVDKFTAVQDKFISKMGSVDQVFHKTQNNVATRSSMLATSLLNSGNDISSAFLKASQQSEEMAGKVSKSGKRMSSILQTILHPIQSLDEQIDRLGNSAPNGFQKLLKPAGEAVRFFYELGQGAKAIGKNLVTGFGKGIKSAEKFAAAMPINAVKKFGSVIKQTSSEVGKTNPFSAMQGQLMRFSVSMLSIRKLIQAFKNQLEDAPQEIQDNWGNMVDGLKRLGASGIQGILAGMQAGINRLNQAMSSPAGQQFANGMYQVGQMVGQAIGMILQFVGTLVEFIGNNFSTVMTIAIVLLGVYAVNMLISAAATLAAAWPLLLIVGVIIGVITILNQLGFTSADIFGWIGELVGALYAFVYNIVADVYNLFISFAEFFANFLNDPVSAIVHLFIDMADFILGIVENIVAAIDWLLSKIGFATDMAGAINGAREAMQGWADDTFGAKQVKLDRMEHIDYTDTANAFGDAGRSFGESIDNIDLSSGFGGGVSNIETSVGGSLGSDVAAIKKEVSLSEEELKSLVDIAQREYINNINLTTQSPVIQVQGQNTGDTAKDRKDLADAIRDILLEQSSAATIRSTARVY